MNKAYVRFDPRSKLCTIFFASFLLMFPLPFNAEILFVSLLYALFILNGAIKKGTIFYVVFWLFILGDHWLFPYIDNGIAAFFDFLLVGNRRLLPTIMAATFAMNQTKISEWIAALKKCHIPFGLIVPLTVLVRFFPTLFHDFKSIRNAMKYRGIAVTTLDLFIHPFQTMEYIIVPILMTAENTSIDLSSAALVRGLANPTLHTSVYDIRLNVQDYILIVLLIVGGIFGRML
ncbi:energy-coupling factor transporter transmembrane component T [Enterococcus termitis]|uniref:Cobalt ABC transporter permease n=1 Tax=Enterococcus termitis TaxID=332950 RepID=A0A1E5GJ09_9ENTE|nr:energy-coupling factor transporter transmembrane component T [Enterococcus termitis]OEG12230.1 cobalt ABC transporter permease [Enterococcus termitis]